MPDLTALTLIEKDHLLHIYHTRLRLFTLAYSAVVLYALLCCFRVDYRDRMSGRIQQWTAERGDHLVSRNQMIMINILFLEGPLLFMGYRVYRKRIACFKKDAVNGIKEVVPYKIIRKTYLPHTNEFFISFDDPNYMHHEVNVDFYMNCNEGDTAYLYRAPSSKYIFDREGKFSLM
jgi:hypothetical protein